MHNHSHFETDATLPAALCRICDVARATGDDGLCDGCRAAVTLARGARAALPELGALLKKRRI